jgi:hypothetical protein
MNSLWKAAAYATGFSAMLSVLGSCGSWDPTSSSDGLNPPEGTTTLSQAIVSNNTITQAADAERTGWYPDQPNLDPSVVGSSGFKRLFQTTLPSAGEQVYAQPLVNGGSVFIATEANNIYTLDAVGGGVLKSRFIGKPFDPTVLQCGDLLPTIGITGTPVIDTTTNTAYFYAKVADASNNAHWEFHAVDATSLVERGGFPVTITGNATNDPTLPFVPQIQHQRPALLLMNGVVYGAFGAHCDKNLPTQKYRGWVIGVSTAGTITTMYTDEDHTGDQAGIWQSGGGIVSDGPGRIFFITGNGKQVTTPTPGNTPPTFLGESLAQLQVQGDGSLKTMQFFSPYNLIGDQDFGAGGPVSLPSQFFGTAATPHLMIAIGKLPVVYTVDRDHLGGFEESPAIDNSFNPPRHKDLVVSLTTVPGNGSWSKPAVWPGDGGWAYVVSSGAPLQAMKYGLDGQGIPTFTTLGGSSDTIGFTSGAPVVTSNGTNAGSAVVWISRSGGGGQSGQLRAYQAVPVSGTLKLLFADTYGLQVKFANPGVGAGRIYMGGHGTVTGWGSSATGSVSGPLVDFGAVPTNTTKTLPVTMTASQALTVSALASSDPAFTIGASTPALPAQLAQGASLTVQVTFAPTAATAYAGQVNATTSVGPGSVPIKGLGQFNGAQLTISPVSIAYGTITTGTTKSVNAILQNTGNQPATFTGFTQPAAPFTITGLPANGSQLAAGASVTVTATYAPTVNGNNTGTFVAQSNGGNASLSLTGAAGPPPKLVISSLSLNYGTVAVGASKPMTFTVSNQGGSDLVIQKSKPPALGQFNAQAPALPEASVLTAGQTVTETVTFTPTAAGSFSDSWIINTNDAVAGLQTVNFTGTATGTAGPLPRAGWVASASPTSGDVPANAIDGNLSTRFSTGAPQANGQWFQVDMLSTQSFTQITMDTGGSTNDYARGYAVYVSNDGVNFGTAVATGAGNTGVTTVTFAQQSARYIRVIQTGTATSWWSIAEFNVYGSGGGGGHTVLPRTGWVATASPTSGTPASNAIDGNLSTRYTTGAPQTNGQWFQVDMLSAQTFTQITLDAAGNPGDYPHGYSVTVSSDGVNWSAPIASGPGSTQLITITFAQQSARYLRVTQTGTATNWWSLAEFNVYQ